jgi:hypothetical protein
MSSSYPITKTEFLFSEGSYLDCLVHQPFWRNEDYFSLIGELNTYSAFPVPGHEKGRVHCILLLSWFTIL